MAFKLWHSHPDKSEIIITAGVDGDEYAGIRAARELIKIFTLKPPSVPLTIIPLVNKSGYQKGVDYNPLDGRFPKHIYPGLPLGTSSSRLMWKLSRIVRGHKLWIDLHGGNRKEHLSPFLWADQVSGPGSKLIPYLLSHLPYPSLYSSSPSLTPSRYLANRQTAYLVFECGQLGRITAHEVNQHLTLVKKVLRLYPSFSSGKDYSFTPAYTKLVYKQGSPPTPSPHNLLWCGPNYYYLGT